MTKIRLYSPNQVALISLLATPVAGALVLAKNFAALGNRAASMRIMLWGGLFFIWFWGMRFWGVSSQPGIFMLIHIGCISSAHQIAVRYQMPGFANCLWKPFDVQSDEMVAAVIAGFLITLFVLFVTVAIVLDSLGVPVLEYFLTR